MKILLVESGTEFFKDRFLRELTNNEDELFLLVNSSPRLPKTHWYHRHIPPAHVFSADFRDVREAARSVKSHLAASGIQLSGATTYYEDAILVTQAIIDELSLTPITTGDPLALRNKGLMRARFSAAGLPQPKAILCRTRGEAKEAIKEVGLPCVVKPSQMSASVGVRKVSQEADIDGALDAAFTADISEEDTRFAYNIPVEVIVEEYIPTYQEVSCEGLVQQERVQLLSVTKKYLSREPLFEEIGHATPYPVSDEIRVMIEDQLHRAASALGLYSTAFHAEFRLRQEASPVLVELGARLPGGFIPQLVQLARGVDMIEASLRLAAGREYTALPRDECIAAIRFLQDEAAAGKFAAGAARVRALPFVDELSIYGGVGIGRRGHVIWTAQDFGSLEDRWTLISETCQ